MVVPNPKATNEDDQWIDKTINKFLDVEQTVVEYRDFLYRAKAEKEGKRAYDRTEIVLALEKLIQEMAYLVDLRNKIIVFTEEPSKEFWAGFLPVLSHDTYWTKLKFVEGEGVKHTKLVVFRGWPTVIYCTSKTESSFGWQDLNTRFEVIEPVQTKVKYEAGVDLVFNDLFAWRDNKDYNELQRKLRDDVQKLVDIIKDKPIRTFTPFSPDKLWKQIGEIKFGSLMRTLKYWGIHLQMETLWNVQDRFCWANGTNYVLVAAQDVKNFYSFYDTIELQAELNGLTSTAMEFYANVLVPAKEAKTEKQNELSKVTEKNEDCALYGPDVAKALETYVSANSKITRLKPYKLNMSRYAKELESKYFIKLEKSQEPGRGNQKEWDLRVPKEELTLVSQLVSSFCITPQELAFTTEKIRHSGNVVSKGFGMKYGEKLGLDPDQENTSYNVIDLLKESGYETTLDTSNDTTFDTTPDTSCKVETANSTDLISEVSDTSSKKWNSEGESE